MWSSRQLKSVSYHQPKQKDAGMKGSIRGMSSLSNYILNAFNRLNIWTNGPKLMIILPLLFICMGSVMGNGLRLQACDDDFRQMSNWLCTRPGEKTPCYKFYFDVDIWKGLFHF